MTNTNEATNPHADLILEYANDWIKTDKPWELWQHQAIWTDDNGESPWLDCNDHPKFRPKYQYRRKPKTININGFEVPEPLKIKPQFGQQYYVPWLSCESLFDRFEWQDDNVDNRFLGRGLCHLDKEPAIIHAKALLSFTESKAENGWKMDEIR